MMTIWYGFLLGIGIMIAVILMSFICALFE